MPYNGSGVFTLVAGNPVVTGTVISSTVHNNTMSDIANNGLTLALTKDGQQTPTADIPMGGFEITGLGNATQRDAATSAGQIQDNGLTVLNGIGGTGDAITAVTNPAITAYATNAKFTYIPAASNTIAAPTINIDSIAAEKITQSNGLGLWAGALVVGTPYELLYDGTNFRVQSGQLGSASGNSVIPQGTQFGFRNRIIDGNFDFWDSGTSGSVAASQAYASTMFFVGAGSGGTPTGSWARGTFTPGAEPAGMASPTTYFLSYQQTAAASSIAPYIGTNIESVATDEGRTITFSAWLWVPSGTLNITQVQISQIFGTGGSSTVNNQVAVAWTLTTTPQRFSVSIALPSISGKTVGTSNRLQLTVTLPVTSTFTINTTQWQFEDSPANAPATGLPTPFEFRGYATEKSMVARFYKNFSIIKFWVSATAANTQLCNTITFSDMRIAPAVSYANVSYGNCSGLTFTDIFTAMVAYLTTSTAAGPCAVSITGLIFDARF